LSTLHIEPLPGVGAVATGIALSPDMPDAEFAALKAAYARHGLLFFRDQALSPEDHIAFARRWAPIDINRFFKAVDGYPEIAEVGKEPDQTHNIGGGWHTDHSYDVEPAMGSILVARVLPQTGGDTWFSSMYAAYHRLSDALKEKIEGLRGVHSSRHIFGAQGAYKQMDAAGRIGNEEAATQDVTHPVVITHPLSGQKALYVNPAFTIGIEGWSKDESDALLFQLYPHCIAEDVTYRFKWEEGSVAFWDNRATWHYALNDYHGQRRIMHRVTVSGCALN
jgi:taurine dioxygenase